MGINIAITKLLSKELTETWSNTKEWYYNTQDQDWFDYTRHSDDRDFAVQILLNKGEELDQDSGLIRPIDIDKAIEWVEGHIEFKGNKRRLTTALKKLKEDKDLYFTISW